MQSILKDKFLWLLFLALIILRLPTINRPLSKHHEFAVAVVLINAESWQQAGGGNRFHYTPLMNYQGFANRMLDTGWHIDSLHNHVYLSFGAGWYVLPYFVLKAAGLPFTPLWLELLNIFINLVTVAMLYGLLRKVTGNKRTALAGTTFFAFLPAPLWYCGNGYVSNSIMLPLVIALLYIWHRFEKDRNHIRPATLISLFISGVLLSYFDWVSVFLLAGMAVWALVKTRKDRRYFWVALVSIVTIVAGIWLVLAQFASYLGWAQVLGYWKSRFAERSTNTAEFSLPQMLVMVIQNLVTGYLPLFFVLPLVWLKRKALKQKGILQWPLWALATMLPYNGIFLNWSAVHEFAWLAFGLIAVVGITIYLFPLLSTRQQIRLIATCVGFSIVQYFIINRPGPVSWKGDRYASKKNLGEWIRTNIDPGLPVFTNVKNEKIIEFYSKRTFNNQANLQQAKKQATAYHIQQAVWMQVDADTITALVPFTLP